MSPERGAPAPYFCRGAMIRLEDGSLRRVEEMRTEDFVSSAGRSAHLALTKCTLLRLDERGDNLALTLTYDRNRTQVTQLTSYLFWLYISHVNISVTSNCRRPLCQLLSKIFRCKMIHVPKFQHYF